MKSSKELREKIGLTQPEMASFLGIKPGMLSMIENGRRSLPIQCIAFLEYLDAKIQEAEKVEVSPKIAFRSKEQDQSNREDLLYHAVKCRKEAKELRKMLEKNAAVKAQVELASRLPALEQDDSSKKETFELILDIKRMESIEKLLEDNRGKDLFLQLRIETLEDEAARATRMAEALVI